MSWINDLDACASAGIISFDAPAYVKGVQPRYVGNPDFAQIPDYLPAAPQPQKDEFTKTTDPHHNPKWKKALFGTVVVGALAAGIYAISKGKINLKNLKLGKRINVYSQLAVRWMKNIPTKIKNLHLMDKLKNLFKKPATP